jgi:hypothetical protein
MTALRLPKQAVVNDFGAKVAAHLGATRKASTTAGVQACLMVRDGVSQKITGSVWELRLPRWTRYGVTLGDCGFKSSHPFVRRGPEPL